MGVMDMANRLLADELCKYLLELAARLERHGEAAAAKRVIHVSGFSSGSTSELYGEARMVLPEILRGSGYILLDSEREHLRTIVAGIEAEFQRIGGA